MKFVEGRSFRRHILDGLLGHLDHRSRGIDQRSGGFKFSQEASSTPAIALRLVKLRTGLGHVFGIARKRFVGLIGNTGLEQLKVAEPDEAIAKPYVAIKKGEGLSWLQRLNPKGDLTEFHGQGIAVD